MGKFSTRLTIVGACIAVTAGLMASMGGAAAAAIPSEFTVNAANKTMTLNTDITTDTTIGVPNGYTLNGNGHTITAVDPVGGAFNGAVVQNDDALMHVKNLKIAGASTAVEQCARVLNGVAFMAASGSIKNVTLTDIGLPETGCQIGRAILVDNTGSGTDRHSVEISGNVVSSYNKNGIDVRGKVDATIVGNTVTGLGPLPVTVFPRIVALTLPRTSIPFLL